MEREKKLPVWSVRSNEEGEVFFEAKSEHGEFQGRVSKKLGGELVLAFLKYLRGEHVEVFVGASRGAESEGVH